ncbi:hypothetical protein HWX16_20710 [Ochrobactrum intermedium]|uniref:hypothetical protein n=1 Tax=Brucella intermedia TaxID=94625 RepID=UPI00159C476E|nr:hypothetical protein [Brucella intermedia]NVM42738.1 hypothetical protein [Brucella intermedia]
MKYFHIIVDGREVWGSGPVLPEDATEMSETEWQAGIDAARMQPAATLLQIKSALKVGIDAAAEAERLKYITPGHGQAMTYQQKVAEAQAYKAATTPQPSDYPILSSEIGITAETIDEVADVVLAAFAQWQQIGAMVESIRLGAKRDIDAAEDETEARAIVDVIVWPSAQVQS